MQHNPLTADRLRQLLDYEPATGVFTWKVNRSIVKAGQKAGVNPHGGDGYPRIGVDGQQCLAHRLAWLHVHGRFPDDEIDHINGIRSDNRLSNLREATTTSKTEGIEKTPIPTIVRQEFAMFTAAAPAKNG